MEVISIYKTPNPSLVVLGASGEFFSSDLTYNVDEEKITFTRVGIDFNGKRVTPTKVSKVSHRYKILVNIGLEDVPFKKITAEDVDPFEDSREFYYEEE